MLRRDFLKTVTASCGICLAGGSGKIMTSLSEMEDSHELQPGIQELPLDKVLVGCTGTPMKSNSQGILNYTNWRIPSKVHDEKHIRVLAESIENHGQLLPCICSLSRDSRSVILVTGFARVHAIMLINSKRREASERLLLCDVRHISSFEQYLIKLHEPRDRF